MERIKFDNVDIKPRTDKYPGGVGQWSKVKSIVVATDDIEYCYCEGNKTNFMHKRLIIQCDGNKTKDLIKS